MSAYADARTISVIVPTAAFARRRALVWRAIESILSQRDVSAIPIVIVNGPSRDRAVTRELLADRRLRVHVLEEAGLPHALQAGRRLVDTPWFAELDDDDLLLPDALSLRIAALAQSDDHDCVVTNGYRRNKTEDVLNIPDMSVVARDPIRAFWDRNWLLPGSSLCRTDRVADDVFDGMPASMECTYVALRLALAYRIRFLQRPTVIWHAQRPGSLSHSRHWILSSATAHERLLALDLPPDVQGKVQERITMARHSASDLCLREGNRSAAWGWHLRSLVGRGGHRYLPYTAKLMYKTLTPLQVVR